VTNQSDVTGNVIINFMLLNGMIYTIIYSNFETKHRRRIRFQVNFSNLFEQLIKLIN